MQGARVPSLVGELDPTCMPQLRSQHATTKSSRAATKSSRVTTKSQNAATKKSVRRNEDPALVFGSRLDIHSGGIDLAFPHHENEIAQCEVFHQCQQWGNYFLHSGHLHVKGKEEKMSKSLKNYITIKDFLSTASPDVFRLFCLRSSYRSAVDYSDSAMLEARRLLRAVAAFVGDARAYMRGQLAGGPVQEDVLWERLGRTKGAVQAALADDFDTPGAVDAVTDLAHHGNRQLKAAAEAAGGPRSPAVFGAIVSYVEQFFETVGISLAERQVRPSPFSP
ncbi:Cysteine--tRNA ligase, mitochondrial, partial [Eschrichtius robustus]|nr:Cysteine--tRNA ligase, mitochondrial [Eschrichtius robustus]